MDEQNNEEDIFLLKDKLLAKDNQIKNLQDKLDSQDIIVSNFYNINNKYTESKIEITKLKKIIENMNISILSLKNELKQKFQESQKLNELHKDNEILNKKLISVNEEHNKNNLFTNNLKEQNEKIAKDLEKYKNEILILKNKNVELLKQNKELIEEKKKLNDENTILKSDLGSAKINLDQMNKQNKELTDELNKKSLVLSKIQIETGKIESFQKGQACGIIGIMGLIDFANNNDCSMIRAMMYNSGDISGETDKVVGYGSWFLYPGTRNSYIEKFYSNYLTETAISAIKGELSGDEYKPEGIPSVMTQYGASFVTLKLNGALRGCIGSIFPTKPLILDIIDNAKNAAFYDSRFEPLTERELPFLEINISLLSNIERIQFKDERDLLSKIYPHGIIISDRNNRAVYLPEVWEQLPNREVFLNSLKEKAGLHPDYFSSTFEAYKFSTTVISTHF